MERPGAGVSGRSLRVLFVAAAVSLAVQVAATAPTTSDVVQRQEQINAALQHLLDLTDSGVPFLVYDRAPGELRLQQDRALLRTCVVAVDALGERVPDPEQRLARRLRRYRRSHAYAAPAPSPFDWEQYLAEDADKTCALQFTSGLLIYSSPQWDNRQRGKPGPPSLRIAPDDLRALYNALPDSAVMVILPPGWDEPGQAHER